MLSKILIWFVILKVVIGQFNGDFWWMNNKLVNYIVDPSSPKFEELSEFDTDESDKIIFRDNELVADDSKTEPLNDKIATDTKKKRIDIHFQDKSELSWPIEKKENMIIFNNNESKKEQILEKDKDDKRNKPLRNSDVLEFKFPETDNIIWKDTTTQNNTISTSTTVKNISDNKNRNSNKVVFESNKIPNTSITTETNFEEINKPKKCASIGNKRPFKANKDDESESICTFMKKVECYRINGIVYVKRESGSQRPLFETQLVCCILPLSKNESAKIHFRDFSTMTKRYKRSDAEINPALKQRNALLLRKFVFPSQKTKPTPTPEPTNLKKKIVTIDDDNDDPYWNIKNSNFKTPKPENYPNKKTGTNAEYSNDYVEDYIAELPTPGLVGLYSDGARPSQKPSWSFTNDNTGPGPYGSDIESEEDDGGTSFGYGPSLDPRLVDRVSASTSRPFLGRPLKLSTKRLDDHSYNAESQTISYQSTPDFQVLQGFKLLNLVRNKSRIYRTGKKSTTTERILQNDSEEIVIAASFEDDYDDFDRDHQLYKECGKAVNNPKDDYNSNKQIGEARKGSHPWLGMIVLTRRRHSILCYATVVHARAAVTAADCVHGKSSPGEITFIAGAWDLSDESHEGWQKRKASIHIHSKYKPGDLAHNLAILYWKQPLRLNANVQPVCLADPHVGDNCRFHGWGGYDQAIRPHSRWQRASILTPRACDERLTSNKQETLPKDAFCASVQSRGTVTGAGGPLTCAIGNRHTAVGIAVWRDHAVVMSPIHEWTTSALKSLRI